MDRTGFAFCVAVICIWLNIYSIIYNRGELKKASIFTIDITKCLASMSDKKIAGQPSSVDMLTLELLE